MRSTLLVYHCKEDKNGAKGKLAGNWSLEISPGHTLFRSSYSHLIVIVAVMRGRLREIASSEGAIAVKLVGTGPQSPDPDDDEQWRKRER